MAPARAGSAIVPDPARSPGLGVPVRTARSMRQGRSGARGLLCDPTPNVLGPPDGNPRRQLDRLWKRLRFDPAPQRGLRDRNEQQDLRLPQKARFGQAEFWRWSWRRRALRSDSSERQGRSRGWTHDLARWRHTPHEGHDLHCRGRARSGSRRAVRERQETRQHTCGVPPGIGVDQRSRGRGDCDADAGTRPSGGGAIRHVRRAKVRPRTEQGR